VGRVNEWGELRATGNELGGWEPCCHVASARECHHNEQKHVGFTTDKDRDLSTCPSPTYARDGSSGGTAVLDTRHRHVPPVRVSISRLTGARRQLGEAAGRNAAWLLFTQRARALHSVNGWRRNSRCTRPEGDNLARFREIRTVCYFLPDAPVACRKDECSPKIRNQRKNFRTIRDSEWLCRT